MLLFALICFLICVDSCYTCCMEALSEKLFDSLARIPRHYYLPIGIGILGLIFFGIGLMQLIGSANIEKVQSSISSITPISQISLKPTSGITVDVEGAVVAPGVYTIPFASRLKDALVAAGGLSAGADREYVAKQINLAAKVTDGAKIYIPSTGEVSSPSTSSGQNDSVSAGIVLGSQTGLININTASEKDLDSLPGIGSVTAGKIIAARPFSSIEELLTRKIVKQSVFDKIKEQITAN